MGLRRLEYENGSIAIIVQRASCGEDALTWSTFFSATSPTFRHYL